MPSELLYRRYFDRIRERAAALKPGVLSVYSLKGLDPSRSFIDYGIRVPGTLPEKMVYNVLEKKNVGFYFGYYFGDIPFTSDEEHYRPDFILPDYNIIIEVVGVYWHSREGSFSRDYQRALWLIAAGWNLVTVLDEDILRNAYAAIENAIPSLIHPPTEGNKHIGFRPFDPTASLRAQRQKYPKSFVATFARRTLRKGNITRAWKAAGNKIRRPKDLIGDVFQAEDVDPSLAAQYRNYGVEWAKYIEELGVFFKNTANRGAYPEEYSYYLRWKNWWDRFGRIE
jgi:hypothetical protein